MVDGLAALEVASFLRSRLLSPSAANSSRVRRWLCLTEAGCV